MKSKRREAGNCLNEAGGTAAAGIALQGANPVLPAQGSYKPELAAESSPWLSWCSPLLAYWYLTLLDN